MEIEIPLYGEPCTLAVTIWCDSPKAIRLIVEDAENEDQIKEDGQVVPTPARISQTDGMMEVSKADFLRYTVPMRMAILLHEFAHFYLNEVMEDEVEADHNSLQLYLGMGYPRIDAYNVYLDVFENSPSELNKDRYEALNKLFQSNYKGR